MTIDKAIEILTEDTNHPTAGFMPDLKNAEMLGIKALKKIKECQEHNCTLSSLNLPGETKD